MTGILGGLLFLLVAVLWSILAGYRTGTIPQSFAMLGTQALLTFALFANNGLSDDQGTYYLYAQRTAAQLYLDPLAATSGFSEGKESFVWILALLMLIFGDSAVPGLMMNVMFLTALPAIFVWAGRNMGVFYSGRFTAWIVVVAPPILLWGPGLKREALVFLLISLLMLALSLVYREKYLVGGMLFLVVLGSFVTTRSSMLTVCGAGIIAIALLLAARKLNKWRIGHSLFVRLLPVSLVTFALAMMPQAIYSASVVFSQTNLLGLGVGIPELSHPGQATAVPSVSGEFNSSPGGLIYNFLRTLVGPMPWEVNNWSLLIFWVEGIGYFLLLSGLLYAYLSMRWLRGRILLLVATASPLLVAATLLLANYGLNSRIRAHVFLILVLFLEPYAAHISRTHRSLADLAPPFKNFRREFPPETAAITGHKKRRIDPGYSEGSTSARLPMVAQATGRSR